MQQDIEDRKRQWQEATDLVGLIGEHVELAIRGGRLVGCCPFHEDRENCLRVSAATQIYRCSNCGAEGDIYTFVMSYYGLGIQEAIQFLQQRWEQAATGWAE